MTLQSCVLQNGALFSTTGKTCPVRYYRIFYFSLVVMSCWCSGFLFWLTQTRLEMSQGFLKNSVEPSQTQLEMAHPLVKRTKISFGLHKHGWWRSDRKHLALVSANSWKCLNVSWFCQHKRCFRWMDFPYKISGFGCHRHGRKCSEVSFKTPGLSPQTQLDITQFPVKNKYWFWSCSGRQNPFSKHQL